MFSLSVCLGGQKGPRRAQRAHQPSARARRRGAIGTPRLLVFKKGKEKSMTFFLVCVNFKDTNFSMSSSLLDFTN